MELLKPSPHRVEPRCRHFGQCGGCSLQHLDAESQIEVKQRVLKDNFERIGKVSPALWLPPLTDEAWGYRRKGRLSVRQVAKKGRVLVGFREESNPRFVADISQCEVVHPALGRRCGLLADLVAAWMRAPKFHRSKFAAGDDTVALVFGHVAAERTRPGRARGVWPRAWLWRIYLQPGGVEQRACRCGRRHPRARFVFPAATRHSTTWNWNSVRSISCRSTPA